MFSKYILRNSFYYWKEKYLKCVLSPRSAVLRCGLWHCVIVEIEMVKHRQQAIKILCISAKPQIGVAVPTLTGGSQLDAGICAFCPEGRLGLSAWAAQRRTHSPAALSCHCSLLWSLPACSHTYLIQLHSHMVNCLCLYAEGWPRIWFTLKGVVLAVKFGVKLFPIFIFIGTCFWNNFHIYLTCLTCWFWHNTAFALDICINPSTMKMSF